MKPRIARKELPICANLNTDKRPRKYKKHNSRLRRNYDGAGSHGSCPMCAGIPRKANPAQAPSEKCVRCPFPDPTHKTKQNRQTKKPETNLAECYPSPHPLQCWQKKITPPWPQPGLFFAMLPAGASSLQIRPEERQCRCGGAPTRGGEWRWKSDSSAASTADSEAKIRRK